MMVTSCIWVALAASACMTLCLSGCCLYAINKVKKNQIFTESYIEHHQPHFAVGSGVAIGGGSQYAPVANQLDTSAAENDSGYIARGMAIN